MDDVLLDRFRLQIDQLQELVTADQINASDEVEIVMPDRVDGTCTLKDCSVTCQNVDEEKLSAEILSLPLEVNLLNKYR